jgi:DNA-damage-inducible protein J
MSTIVKENKSNLIQVRLDDKTKLELETVLSLLGLTTSQAVLMYVKQIVLKKKIPFEISISNDLNYNELTQEEFRRIQGKLVTSLDRGETIPEFHEKNLTEFKFKSNKKK